MKEKLTLRNIIICSCALLAVLVFCLSFAVKGYMDVEGSHIKLFNAVWNPAKVFISENGHSETIILRKEQTSVFALPLIGFILVLVAGIGAVVVSFLFKNEKLAKILVLVCAGLGIVGGVFMFFVSETTVRTFCMAETGSLDDLQRLKDILKESGGKYYTGTLGIICGVLSILGGVAIGVSQFLTDKKLAK